MIDLEGLSVIDKLPIIIQTVGGVGLFLLGMIVMTEGLRALAGDTVRAALMRFTRSPLTGAVSGAVSTAILQSSSAMTIAAVGFVGAGLMSFPEALGIIFGANIGTTITGWIVALFGFKFNLGILALPFIFAGTVLRLFTRNKLAMIGYAIAGFGLMFVGIAMMQEGMSGLQGMIPPAFFPDDSVAGRLKLVLLGIIATVITHSSSAGVAATLTALYTDTINFEQAAALVIGMDIGTTVTAAMATIGASTGARRTGLSHVIYNLFTALGALILITPYTLLWEAVEPGQLIQDAEIALVAFHTMFNTLGVMIVLPFTSQFAHLVERLVPEKGPIYMQRLDKAMLAQPRLALTAVQSSINTEMITLLAHVNAIVGITGTGERADLPKLQEALDKTQVYVDQIHLGSGQGADWERLVAIIHTLDHLQRLHERCEEEEDRANTVRITGELSDERDLLITTISEIIGNIEAGRWIESAQLAGETASRIHEEVEPYRAFIMAQIASGEIGVPEGTARLQAIRWLRRVSKHIARITQHHGEAVLAAGK